MIMNVLGHERDKHARMYPFNHSAEPMSPRSALRSLQEPSSSELSLCGKEDHTKHKMKHSSTNRPLQCPLGPLPPRKSSLAAMESNDRKPLHLPLPPQPMLEDSRFASSSPLPYAGSPPRVSSRCASINSSSTSMHPGSSVYSAPRLPHRQSYSSARSIHSMSDSSSVISLPLPTPPDSHQGQVVPHLHAPVFERRGTSLTYSDRYDRSHHQQTSRPAPAHETVSPTTIAFGASGEVRPHHESDDSPFAYNIEPRPEATSDRRGLSRERPPYEISQHQSHWTSSYAAQPPRRASSHLMANSHHARQIPAVQHRSVDDYMPPGQSSVSLNPLDSHGVFHHTPRPSIVGQATEQSGLNRASFESGGGRVLAPLRRSPASVSHRASLNSMASSSDLSESSVSASVMPIHRFSHPTPISSSDDRDVNSAWSHYPPSPVPSTASGKRQRGWTMTETDYHESPAQRPARPPQSPNGSRPTNVMPSFSTSQRRSRSADRLRSNLKQLNNSTPSIKLEHAEVMARLNRKMKERIAAKQQKAAAASHANSLPLAAGRHRGDSASSSLPSTPATSAISLNSPALAYQPRKRSTSPPVPTSQATADAARAPPVIGIESLLSAAAINDSRASTATPISE